MNLREQVQDWQTPGAMEGGNKSRGGKRKGELLLAGQVKAQWLTPKGRDVKGESQRGEHAPGDVLPNMVGLHAQESRSTDGKNPGSSRSGVLNSRWVAQLQGFPSDWCDVQTETP
jgi:hypothetical protein